MMGLVPLKSLSRGGLGTIKSDLFGPQKSSLLL